MNTLAGNVISLRPANDGSLHWLALSLGNAARMAEEALRDAREAAALLSRCCEDQTTMAASSTVLSADFDAVMRQLDHCLMLSHELNRR